MKVHSNDLKNNIKRIGRILNAKITYTDNGQTIELDNSKINSIVPHFNSNILKSTMKQLDLDYNLEIPEGTILNYRFGVYVNDVFEYLNFGNYVVCKVEKQEDLRSYKIICYDKMLYSMKNYVDMNLTYPMTVRQYINSICQYLGLTFKNANDTFVNYDKIIDKELYLGSDGNSLGYTFRDVLDELAEVTASTICINETDDKLEIRYINDTQDVINEDFFKDINVTFSEKYGPINSVVLSRSGESDNVYLQDAESIEANGLCEIKIKDNQIMNFNDRSTYLPEILQQLDGLEYYINDFTSTGIGYYDLCDKYYAQIGNNLYTCIMFNDEFIQTTGVEENINTEMPEVSETDYKKSDKTDMKINQTYIIVDKQNSQIDSVVKAVNEQNTKITNITQTMDNINITVSNQQNIFNNLNNSVVNIEGTLQDMSFNFNTQGLTIGTSANTNNVLIDNTGLKVYNYSTLNAIFNNKGSGIGKLIVTDTAQLGYLKFIKATKNGSSVTKIFHLKQAIEDLEDLI